jgi:hypothetical protein
LIQQAREFQQSEDYAPYRRLRQAAEHRLARLVQLGIRQARYFGRKKTLFQLLMVATVANLTLVATKMGQMRTRGGRKHLFCSHVLDFLIALATNLALSLARDLAPKTQRRPQYALFG